MQKPFLYRIFPANKYAEILASAADNDCVDITNDKIICGAECRYGSIVFSVGILNAHKRVCLPGVDGADGAFGWWSTRRVYVAVMRRKNRLMLRTASSQKLSKAQKVAKIFIDAGFDPDFNRD